MKVLLILLVLAALLYVLVRLLIAPISRRLIFKPTRLRETIAPTFEAGTEYEDVWFETADGERLHGWYCWRHGNQGLLMLCHGNKACIEHRPENVEFYLNMGLNVFVFDYRGYGVSSGRPTEAGTYLDVEAAWRYLTVDRDIAPNQIVLLGRSLGGAIAAHLAHQAKPAAIILESTFTSVPNIARELFPLFSRLIATHLRYFTIKKVGQFRAPLLIVHSSEDELIDIAHGLALQQAAAPGTRFLEIKGRHRDGFASSAEIYVPGVRAFIQEHLEST